ncbi:hypothetical protein HRbin08_00335 [bacterium HR08]|nr:hypothetical protein HRbin08_00335 [bacterium HR08]
MMGKSRDMIARTLATGMICLFILPLGHADVRSRAHTRAPAQSSGPRLIVQFDAKPVIALLPDGTLMAVFLRTVGENQEMRARFSRDNGMSWSEERTLSPLPAGLGRWGGLEVLVDRRGEIHLFTLNDAGTAGRPMPERRLDIWHAKTESGRARWRPWKRIWQGYTGALNSVIQLRSGRLLLPFSYYTGRSWSQRGEGLLAFLYMGVFEATVLYSDDEGETWALSPSILHVPAQDITSGESGAVEPVVLELRDGRVWMLIRTQRGRLYESYSLDGGLHWSRPRPSRFLSSESPAGLTRLTDGRILLLWNNCQRFPYAYGGRHVLHAAISEDEGRTWRGYREVARDPLLTQPPPPRGDFGTAYPYPTPTPDGKVIFTTGQGAAVRLLTILLDPAWLYETVQRDDFSKGLSEWSSFGTRGVEVIPHPEKPGAQVLSLRKTDPEWPATAVRNFPIGKKGRLSLRFLLRPGFKGLRLGLTDHFSVPYDLEDDLYAAYALEITGEGRLAGERVDFGRWHELRVEWDVPKREARAFLDGREVTVLPLLRQTEGICYLRLSSTAEETDEAGILIESVEADVGASWLESPSGPSSSQRRRPNL